MSDVSFFMSDVPFFPGVDRIFFGGVQGSSKSNSGTYVTRLMPACMRGRLYKCFLGLGKQARRLCGRWEVRGKVRKGRTMTGMIEHGE